MSNLSRISISVPGFMPEPRYFEDTMDIPGFPEDSTKPAGFAAGLQGHLEKLSANAKSIHHVLEALCGGLDRLERKLDTNSSQMEARMANIVHHMSGEADEDTMSEWGSLGGANSPVEIAHSLSRRHGPISQHMPSFAESHLDDGTGDGGGNIFDEIRGGDVQPTMADAVMGIIQLGRDTATGDVAQVSGDKDVGEASPADPRQLAAPVPSDQDLSAAREAVEAAVDGGSSKIAEGTAAATELDPHTAKDDMLQFREEATEDQAPPGTGEVSPRRRSNQDDQSDVPDSKLCSAAGEEPISNGDGSVHLDSLGEPEAIDPQGSISTGGGSDSRYIARQRWAWAFARVCQLIRRRKRKEFEIMSQRATDRAVRMGSRVSVVEKRLDETQEALLKVERLREKALVHTDQMKKLTQKVTVLSTLLGVEGRINGLVKNTQTDMEGMVKSAEKDLEAKLKAGLDDLETGLEGQLKNQRAKLQDMDDRYEQSEDALRLAQDRIGEVQDEVITVSQGVVELERQLHVDEERLDTLESLKKAHERRLSELRMKMNGASPGVTTAELEPDETEAERMSRLLKAAGVAAQFLATDLSKIENKAWVTTGTVDSAPDGGEDRPRIDGTIERLQKISVEAAEYARRCNAGWGERGVDGDRHAVKHAEVLCMRIEDALSIERDTKDDVSPSSRRQPVSLADNGRPENLSLRDIQCPNGRRDLCSRLEAARDAFLPVISERTTTGDLKVALLGLKAKLRAAESMETRWRDLHVQVSALDRSVEDVKEAVHVRGTDGGGSEGIQADLEERLAGKADVFWVQCELQRVWDALDGTSMTMANTSGSDQAAGSSRPRSAPLEHVRAENPETAGEERDAFPSHSDRSIGATLPPGILLSSAVGENPGAGDLRNKFSTSEGSALLKDVLRRIARLEQQVASKADNDEVTKALSSAGTKLRKMGLILPAMEEALSSKIEKKDLNKLAALLSNGCSANALPGGRGNDESNSNSTVLASRLNSKFRCLSCDRPLPALGPPGPPKLGMTGLSIAGADTPRSPQRVAHLRLTDRVDSHSRPSSPATPTSSPGEVADVAGWGESSRVAHATTDNVFAGSTGMSKGTKEAGRRRRVGGGGANSNTSAGVSVDQAGRLEPIGANAPGEQIAGVMSRYPRMMPPPSRIRTAAGGGGAGLGTRPGSTSGGR